MFLVYDFNFSDDIFKFAYLFNIKRLPHSAIEIVKQFFKLEDLPVIQSDSTDTTGFILHHYDDDNFITEINWLGSKINLTYIKENEKGNYGKGHYYLFLLNVKNCKFEILEEYKILAEIIWKGSDTTDSIYINIPKTIGDFLEIET